MKNTCPNKTLKILPQPTETSCGPTCLQAVYSYWGKKKTVNRLIQEIPAAPSGGTYSVMLAAHALKNGFSATIYSYNLRVFDPTWETLSPKAITKKLRLRASKTKSKRQLANLNAYADFIANGGQIFFDELGPKLLRKILAKDGPIIAGLSSTHLYRDARMTPNGKSDDVMGNPEGHFVVITNYNTQKERFSLSDPYAKNPHSEDLKYRVSANRLINSILLGIVTYDANLLVLKPLKKS